MKDCKNQMMAIDPSVPTEDDLHYVPPDSDSNEKTAKDLVQSAIVDRKAFLQLLVRLRRVILQDAVIFRKKDSQGRTLTNSLITSRPDIFESPLFLQFETDLLAAVERHRQQANLFPRDIAIDGNAVVGAVNGLANKVQQLTATTSALQATLSHDQSQDLTLQQLHHLKELMRTSLDFHHRTGLVLRVMSTTMPLPPQHQQGEHLPSGPPQQQQGAPLFSGPEQQEDQASGLLYFQPPLLQQPYQQQMLPLHHPQQQPSQWCQASVRPPGDSWWPQPPAHPCSVQPLARPRPSLKCKSKRSLKDVYYDYLIVDNGVLGDNRTHRRRRALFRDIEKLQKKSGKDMDAFLDELDQELKTAASVEAFTNTIRERTAKI